VTRPALKREVVQHIVSHYGLKMRRACRLIQQTRNVQYYRSVKDPQLALRSGMRELAHTRVRYGYRRIHILLKREGWRPGVAQIYWVYREERLQLRAPKRRKMVVTRQAKIQPTKVNVAWSMDFVADQLADGTRFRTLTIVDVYSKEALAITVGQRLKGEHVVDTLNHIAAKRGSPKYLFVDNGSEFSGRLLDLWAYHHQARIDFSRPAKPAGNCHIETFNGSFRESRPHSTLKSLAPADFARRSSLQAAQTSSAIAEN
jgi:putative transposase